MSLATRAYNGYGVSVEKLIRNMDRHDYNCGGYALETFDWYLPYASYRPEHGYATTNEGVLKYARYICESVTGVRIIKNESELNEDEYLVAFRTCKRDFHFMKRDSQGNWRHKRGHSYRIERITKKEVFSEVWPGEYHSPIVLLAVTK